MRKLFGLAFAIALLPAVAQAGEASDAAVAHLYAGTAADGIAAATTACEADGEDACFGLGLLTLVTAYEGLAQNLYRYGAVQPGNSPAALLFGLDFGDGTTPANPKPEQLTYPVLRQVLDDFVTDIDGARTHFEKAAISGDYVITVDPLRVSIDFNGDGKVDPGETLGALLASLGELGEGPFPLEPAPGHKTKIKPGAAKPDTTIGFDSADGYWFAGYTQIVAAPIDLMLAHDFTAFYDAYLHRVFPKSGLPLGDYTTGGILFLDGDSDAGIADMIAAVHTLKFPVTDAERLAGVLDRLKRISALSRSNWEAIGAETDDNRELVPSPKQTSIIPDMHVTDETVAAWMATLDTLDEVFAGQLLIPHWRFNKGFDLKAYFETATETDLVLLITGSGALPYLKDGPVANAESFAEGNRVFGADWLNYAFWFN
ncbi:hypothetical protein [Devosia sp. 2618]|uniref:hypothetical protein n=1 Tax=Devosia sp. 2618 TaxID=3156454 RepID=UPI003390D8F6